MNLTQLRYFLATAETLNYTKAARQLYVSRQALRQALGLLEQEFQTPLFVNHRNKLSLTAAGEYLRMTGAQALEAFEQAEEGMKRFAGQKESFTIAVSQSLFPFLLPQMDTIIRRFQDRYPGFSLEFQVMSNDEAIRAATENRFNCGLVIQMPCARPGMVMEVLSRYDAIVSFDKSAHLCDLQTVTPQDLSGRHCIGMGSLQETMRPFYEACRACGVRFPYEVVPSAIDAFYRVAHEDVIAFDILKEGIPLFERDRHGFLEGYFWEIGLLYREELLQRDTWQLLCRFIKEEFNRLKQNHD